MYSNTSLQVPWYIVLVRSSLCAPTQIEPDVYVFVCVYLWVGRVIAIIWAIRSLKRIMARSSLSRMWPRLFHPPTSNVFSFKLTLSLTPTHSPVPITSANGKRWQFPAGAGTGEMRFFYTTSMTVDAVTGATAQVLTCVLSFSGSSALTRSTLHRYLSLCMIE